MLQAITNDEPGRIAALRRYEILDTPTEGAFDKVTNLVRTLFGVPISAVSLIDKDRQWFKAIAGLDVQATPRSVAFCDHAIRQSDPLVIPDTQDDVRFRDNPLVTGDPGIRSYAGVPLRTPDGYNIGSLCAIDTRARDFPAEQMEIMKGLAAIVVEQMELRMLAERDHLSGAMTRRAFVAEIDKRIALFVRHQRPAALILLDIDHFKRINDCHGHPVGDRVIEAVAQCCAGLSRPSDSLGRIGGEEFGLLLPETSETEALAAARRFCAAIEALEIPHDPPLRVTASFGVAAIGPGRMTSQDWLTATDAALYEAKRGGRNRAVLAPIEAIRAA
ncbi:MULTISPECIES: sensor domain-containing diguanylate cyclase [Sphingomonas]|uniref:GGDEF domain-containing protein n=1 Tax=Sphingomonas bisphenolicum TaxID=296544 RepID=A0ABM7FZ96_9SPHN|nr:sensor domain-containing diguanylate cyclase [Sphingomonas bisphenolicum]MBA4092348.1 sensor domain-containing diguanylate cyclase [Sphingobium sp.]BBF68234.1 GGDEF domain-containing protein [Sphingomonas bisphenolicum]